MENFIRINLSSENCSKEVREEAGIYVILMVTCSQAHILGEGYCYS